MQRAREMALALAGLALVVPACGGGSGLRGGGGDDGQGGASQVGGQSGQGSGMGGAGNVPCQQITDEQTCNARGAACRVDACPHDCTGGSAFVRCAEPADRRLACAALPCLTACSSLNLKIPCSTSPCPAPNGSLCADLAWCHPIYTEMPPPEVCPSPNVCATYSRCADNGTVPRASANAPLCGQDAPSCATGYLPGINSAGCYEGCVPLAYCSG